MPSQVRNHYTWKNEEAHLARALAFMTATHLHCPSNVFDQIICLCALYYGCLMSPVWLMQQDDDTILEIGDDKSEDTRASKILSNIEEHNFDSKLKVLLWGWVDGHNPFQCILVPLPTRQRWANTVIACPLLQISWKPPRFKPPALPKCHETSLLNKLLDSEHAPSALALPQPKSGGN